MGFVLWNAFKGESFSLTNHTITGLGQTTDQISDSIFSTYLLPFEAASVLLLAALIGAIVLARRD
jgi:NADH-quinone oxidoreductase subunit J